MTKMSLIDKIGVLLELTTSSKISIIVIMSLLFLAYLLISTNKKNFKSSKLLYSSIYVLIICSLLFTYRNSLQNMFDYMMNNFFILVYFPNLAVYLLAIIITNIIIWITVFNTKTTKIIKYINISVYCLMTYLLVLILNIINTNDLDVFTQSSVYSNSNAQALIELSSTIFITWIAFLTVYKIIRRYQLKTLRQAKIARQKQIKETVNKLPNIPKDFVLVDVPYFVKKDNDTIKVEKNNLSSKSIYDKILTVDDYKLLLNILKDHKEKEKQAEQRKQKVAAEQTKYQELQDLYKSVR